MNHIVMLSGGVDSTGVLFQVLKDNDPETVLIHHIRLIDPFCRYKPELHAVQQIIHYCRNNIGNVSFSTSIHEYRNEQWQWDLPIIGMYAALAATDWFAKKGGKILVHTGDNKDDWKMDLSDRREHQNIIFNSFFRHWDDKPEMVYINDELTKQEVYNYIPIEVRPMLWSCREPQNHIQCGACHSCKEAAQLI